MDLAHAKHKKKLEKKTEKCTGFILLSILRRISNRLDPYVSGPSFFFYNSMVTRANLRLFMLRSPKPFGMPTTDLVTIFVGYVRPLLQYACPVWHHGITKTQRDPIERVQKRALRIILGHNYISYAKGGGTGGAGGGGTCPPKISNTLKVPFFLSEKCPFSKLKVPF